MEADARKGRVGAPVPMAGEAFFVMKVSNTLEHWWRVMNSPFTAGELLVMSSLHVFSPKCFNKING